MAAILTALMCPMPLHIVIVYPGAVNGDHLFPARGPREPGICHFSGYVEVRFNVVLPSLPRLDALFADPESCIHIYGLVTVKNAPTITDNSRWHAEARERGKEHFQVVPLILCARHFARQDGAGVIL